MLHLCLSGAQGWLFCFRCHNCVILFVFDELDPAAQFAWDIPLATIPVIFVTLLSSSLSEGAASDWQVENCHLSEIFCL